MNQKVRHFLIQKAIAYETVHYEDVVNYCLLGLNLQSEADRRKLSQILGDVSAYEYANDRPLLSSVAVYKATLDHGFGFYEVAHRLTGKDKQQLIDQVFGFVELKNCRNYWSNPENYQKHYETNITGTQDKTHPLPFYEIADVEFLHQWGGCTYDKTNPEHYAAKEYIMATCGNKAQYWSNMLVKMLPEFETYNPRIWHQKGWDDSTGINRSVAKFKHYSWARIYKKGDEYKDIFFTVEANGLEQALVYKLDYYFEGESNLSKEQQSILKANIPSNLRWMTIKYEEFSTMTWDSLLTRTMDFIAEHSNLYDRLINLVWREEQIEKVFRGKMKNKIMVSSL